MGYYFLNTISLADLRPFEKIWKNNDTNPSGLDTMLKQVYTNNHYSPPLPLKDPKMPMQRLPNFPQPIIPDSWITARVSDNIFLRFTIRKSEDLRSPDERSAEKGVIPYLTQFWGGWHQGEWFYGDIVVDVYQGDTKIVTAIARSDDWTVNHPVNQNNANIRNAIVSLRRSALIRMKEQGILSPKFKVPD